MDYIEAAKSKLSSTRRLEIYMKKEESRKANKLSRLKSDENIAYKEGHLSTPQKGNNYSVQT